MIGMMKKDMHMKKRFGAGLLIVLAVCHLWVGCLGSGIRTTIHDDPQSQVYLEWIPNESFRATHPAEVSQAIIEHILKGIMVQQPSGVIDTLLKQESERTRVFSEEDVEQLKRHLVSALTQVTPEEQVVFKRKYSSDSLEGETAGTLHIKDGLIFFTLTQYAQKEDGPTITFYKGNREIPDPSGLRNLQVSFVPDTAWRQDIEKNHSRNGRNSPKVLALDYKILVGLSTGISEK